MTLLTHCPASLAGISVLLKQQNFHCSVPKWYHHQVTKEDLSILEISEDATREEIRTAYILKAKQFHPDNKSSKEADVKKFQRLNEAYQRMLEVVEHKETSVQSASRPRNPYRSSRRESRTNVWPDTKKEIRQREWFCVDF